MIYWSQTKRKKTTTATAWSTKQAPGLSGTYWGADLGGWIGWLTTPSLGLFKLEIKKGNKTIIEAILSPIVPLSLCQVSPSSPPSKLLDPPLHTLYLVWAMVTERGRGRWSLLQKLWCWHSMEPISGAISDWSDACILTSLTCVRAAIITFQCIQTKIMSLLTDNWLNN